MRVMPIVKRRDLIVDDMPLLLNRLCAAVTGIPVLAGSAEVTAIGWRNRLRATNREVFPMLASLCDCHVGPP